MEKARSGSAMDHLKYSIVIPCHNEAGNIGRLLEAIEPLKESCEVIVVDDGSDDSTFQVAAGFDWVRCTRLPVNQGKGHALQKGIANAQGEYLIFLDGDGQDPPGDIPRLISAAEDGADFVNGSKFLGNLEPGAMSPLNYLGNRFMSWLVNRLFGVRITDSQSGFRCIRADFLRSLNDLSSAEYEVETEILLRAVKAGLAIREVGVRRLARGSGVSGFRRVRNGLRILFTILRERWSV
jgi:glycosyltransferase involved in cell wall biosynthesis